MLRLFHLKRKGTAALAGLRSREHMLRVGTRMLLFSYALLMLKPVMPLIHDRIAHRFDAKAHFSLVHSHDGNSHVHAEMSKLVKEEDGTKTKRSGKQVEDPVQHTIITQPEQRSATFCDVMRPESFYIISATGVPAATDYPPPRS